MIKNDELLRVNKTRGILRAMLYGLKGTSAVVGGEAGGGAQCWGIIYEKKFSNIPCCGLIFFVFVWGWGGFS